MMASHYDQLDHALMLESRVVQSGIHNQITDVFQIGLDYSGRIIAGISFRKHHLHQV